MLSRCQKFKNKYKKYNLLVLIRLFAMLIFSNNWNPKFDLKEQTKGLFSIYNGLSGEGDISILIESPPIYN